MLRLSTLSAICAVSACAPTPEPVAPSSAGNQVAAGALATDTPTTGSPTPHTSGSGNANFPKQFSSDLPYDVDAQRIGKLLAEGQIEPAQRVFDELSWQTFLALNWPATANGEADKAKTLVDTAAPRVWLFWRPADSIFLPEGATPKPWTNAAQGIEQLYRGKAAWRQHAAANENFQAFSGPLVDQHGKWVRYQVLVNKEEFDYIFCNSLFNLDGQVEFSQGRRKLAPGCQPSQAGSGNQVAFPASDAPARKRGAMEIKLAWKELDQAELDSKRFFSMKTTVKLSEPEKKGQPSPAVKEINAGLVGMHIAMPTQSSPEWIWATFEHVDNLRPHDDGHGKVVAPSFYDPKLGGCPEQGDANTAIVNVLAKRNAYLAPGASFPVPDPTDKANTWIESLTTKPVQVCRINVPTQGLLNPLDSKLRSVAQKLNVEVQEELKKLGSVFQYYELIDTQWPLQPDAPAVPGGADSAPESISNKTPGSVVPVFSVNTTMETFFMKGKQPAGPLEQDDRLAAGAPPIDATQVIGTESCVGCHYSAGVAIGFRKTDAGEFKLSESGQRIPIFGQNANFGRNGNAHFSWLLQIEAQALPYSPPSGARKASAAPAGHDQPAHFLKSGGRQNTPPLGSSKR